MEKLKRSAEFEAILLKKPTFLIRWGVYLVSLFLIGVTISARFVAYPLSIPGKILSGPQKRIFVEKRYSVFLSEFIGKDVDLINNGDIHKKYNIRPSKIIAEKNGVMVYIDTIREEIPADGDREVQLLAHSTIYNYIFQK